MPVTPVPEEFFESHFKVDAALLRELGERLVGKPHIALAELVKNGFDADATHVAIRMGENRIEVEDNGHGMTRSEFDDMWMRIGSTHKSRQQVSRKFQRPLTGSKGVGRLAAQFLAQNMRIETTSEHNPESEVVAEVDWSDAITEDLLTDVTVSGRTRPTQRLYVGNCRYGTRIILEDLNQEWDANDIEKLATEIRWLTPPFRPNPRFTTDEQRAFNIQFVGRSQAEQESFERLLNAIFSIWYAKLSGRLIRPQAEDSGQAELVIEWADGTLRQVTYQLEHCRLHEATFEILVYHLHRRQPLGIKVKQARDYLNDNGNVHIYDAGFHLPYYGPDVDWLHVEFDHAHRLTTSKLLPEELQAHRGMNFLPTQSRLLGVVHVDTSFERQQAEAEGWADRNEHLAIQISRDRLVDNAAFENLFKFVRWALDFYAVEEARREFQRKEANAKTGSSSQRFVHLEEILESFQDRIESKVHAELREHIEEAVAAAEEESRKLQRHAGLLGALATAGISALAYQHEHQRELRVIESILGELRAVAPRATEVQDELAAMIARLDQWLEKTRATQALFRSLGERENREKLARLKAREVVRQVSGQIQPLLRGVVVDWQRIDPELRLPRGTFAEWSAIFQNVLINATNAMLDNVDDPELAVTSRSTGKMRALLIQDNGKGVDLENAEELFEPFIRKLKISHERERLGYGGMGLGLTIVRMVATTVGCSVSFVRPDPPFTTAFRISWEELA